MSPINYKIPICTVYGTDTRVLVFRKGGTKINPIKMGKARHCCLVQEGLRAPHLFLDAINGQLPLLHWSIYDLWKIQFSRWNKLTARSSLWEKIRFSWSRTGTIRIRKKGNARDALVDLTTHNIIRHISWTKVKMCIFIVRTCNNAKMCNNELRHEPVFV